jgi:hypothetical protein
MSNRPNLVLLRAGDTSIHPQWLNAPGQQRNWDLIVNYFGDDPDIFRGDDWLRIDSKGPKLPALHEFIRSHEQLIRQYEYVWLPDEDLECTCEAINRFFDVCREHRLTLAQPSLTPDSYFTFPITLHSPPFRLRFTTFVEIMAPCFSCDALWQVWPTMNENLSGWGVDFMWARMLTGQGSSVAIVDEVQIRHTRPCGSGKLYGVVKALGGGSAWDEYQVTLKKFGIIRRYWIGRGKRPSGREISDGWWLLCLYGWGLLLAGARLKAGWTAVPRFWLSAMWQQIKARRRG